MQPFEPLKARVSKIAEAIGTDANGRQAKVLRITFSVGDHGPFTEDFPSVGFDPSAVMQALQKRAASINQVLNAG